MPRSSREQAARHREAIAEASSRLFRERGLKGISIADVMAAAGLTHGGFYGHFPSKDALAAEACARAFGESANRWNQWTTLAGDDRQAMRAAIAGSYLSARHRASPGTGCAAVSLAADIAREAPDKPVRQAYAAGVRQLAANWARTIEAGDEPQRQQRALAELAMMVGAVTLARATEGDPLSDEVLAAVRAALSLPPTD